MIRQETPVVLREGNPQHEALHEYTERLVDWILEDEGLQMRRVVGIYGDRGSGKTSVLVTVLEKLEQRRRDQAAAGERERVVLPNRGQEEDGAQEGHGTQEETAPRNLQRGLFAPAESRDCDELLFLLLAHLEERYRHAHGTEALDLAREAEVRRKDIERFLRYEQEISPSREQIPKRFVDTHKEVARTTLELRKQFDAIVRGCRREGAQTLILAVDDLDLQPHRALELLDILGLFLNQPGVTVLVAADRELLLNSIDVALKTRTKHAHPGLGAALLTKHIPHTWTLPVPSEDERMEFLWSWAASSSSEEEEEEEFLAWQPATMSRERVSDFFGPLLPRSYRGLVALHNLLATLRVQYTHPDERPLKLSDALVARLGPMSISEELLPMLIAMTAALDVQYPQVAPLTWLFDDTRSLGAVVNEFTQRDKAASSVPDSDDEPDIQPGVDELPKRVRTKISSRYLDEIAQLRAEEQFLHFLRSIGRLHRKGKMSPNTRFLAVSLNADAMAMAEPLWRARFSRAEVEEWHIDLRALASDPDHVRAEELARICERADALLRERGILDYKYPIELHIKARLSLAIWLGWKLRYLDQVTIYNLFGSGFTLFQAPAERIRFEDAGNNAYQRLQPEPASLPVGEFQQAVVLIDLLGLSSSNTVNEFVFSEAYELHPSHTFRLSAPPGQRIAPDDAVPLLEEIVELLGHLRHYNGVQHFHLAFIGPDVMAFLLGRQLNAMGRFSLYEREPGESRYRHVLDLDTNG